MYAEEPRIHLRNPDPGKQGAKISQAKYEAIVSAILSIVGREEAGILFKDLADRVAAQFSPAEQQAIGSIGWHTTAVKLDMEARGLLERVPGVSPQRLRRTEKSEALLAGTPLSQ